jgi:hypothetical protein
MTGEWIVFGEVEGIKYYLTLGTHEDAKGDAAPLLQRLKICAIEFPEIQQLLPHPEGRELAVVIRKWFHHTIAIHSQG